MAIPRIVIISSVKNSCRWFLIVILFLLISQSVCNIGHANVLEYNVYEEQPSWSLIGDVKKDSNLTRIYSESEAIQLRFTLRQSNPSHKYFNIDEVSGVLHTSQIIDRDALCPYALQCDLLLDIAVRPLQFFRILKVLVRVLDINDNSPTFAHNRITLDVAETSPIGSLFLLPSAEDADSGPLGVQSYQLQGGQDVFQLRVKDQADGSKDVRLMLAKNIDREEKEKYSVTVVARDGGRQPRSGSIVVDVVVIDSNDNNPRFDNGSYEVNIRENTPAMTTVLRVHATDPDDGPNGHVTYSFSELSETTYGSQIGIDSETGAIFLRQMIDFEEVRSFQLTVLASDSGLGSLPVSAKVTVWILDVNDNAPEISLNFLTSGVDGISDSAQVKENSPPGTFVAHIAVRDRDSERNGDVECVIDDVILFQLESLFRLEYKVTTRQSFDREERELYAIRLTCSDKGRPSMVTSRTIDVTISDENDHSPEIAQQFYDVTVEEENDVGELVLAVNATDADAGRNRALLFRIEPLTERTPHGILAIDPIKGLVTALIKFDFEKRQLYEFLVTVTDHGDEPRSATSSLRLTVLDLNDELPKFEKSYSFTIRENVDLGTSVGQVRATDSDISAEFSHVTYGTLDPRGFFEIDPASGLITTLRHIDREEFESSTFLVTAFNAGVRHHHRTGVVEQARTNVTVYIEDENDNRPIFIFPSAKNNVVQLSGGNTLTAGSLVTSISATDADKGKNADLLYEISGSNVEGLFTINPLTGAITSSVDQEAPPNGADRIYRLVVLVRDEGNPPRASFGDLVIVLNNTLGPITAAARGGGDGRQNAGVIAGVVVGVIVVIVASVLAVLFLRQRWKRRIPAVAADEVVYQEKRLTCRSCSQQLDLMHLQHQQQQSSCNRAGSRNLVTLDNGSTRSLSSYGRALFGGGTLSCRCEGDFGSPVCNRRGGVEVDGNEEDDEDSAIDHIPVSHPLRNVDPRTNQDSDVSDSDRRAAVHKSPHQPTHGRRPRLRSHHPCCSHHPRRRTLPNYYPGMPLQRTSSSKLPMQVTHFCVNDNDTESACSCSDSGQGRSDEEGNRTLSSRNLRVQIL